MTDLTGLELREAESRLKDSVRVLRQKVEDGTVELVVGLFKTKI